MDLQFHGFNVMVVDDDFLHLHALENIFRSFGTRYQMFKFIYPTNALVALQNHNHKFDILLCGIPLSNPDAFNLVHSARRQFNIVIIQMISNYTDDAALQGILIGASHCVAKPITDPQIFEDIWQHVVCKRRDEITMNIIRSLNENSSSATTADGGPGPSCSNDTIGVRIVEEGDGRRNNSDQDAPKRQRFVWSKEYQEVFLEAHDSIKLTEKVIPTKVLEYMKRKGVPNINRENVASHLQKHRMILERKKEKNVTNHQSSTSGLDENKEPISSSNDEDHHHQTNLAQPHEQLGSTSSPQQILTTQEQQLELPPQNQPNENAEIIPPSINEMDQNNNGDIVGSTALGQPQPQPQQNQISSSTLLDQTPFGNNTTYYSTDQSLNFSHEIDPNFYDSYDFDNMTLDWDHEFSLSFQD